MIDQPAVGMMVRIINAGCCNDDTYNKGKTGVIVSIGGDDSFQVLLDGNPGETRYRCRKCMEELNGPTRYVVNYLANHAERRVEI